MSQAGILNRAKGPYAPTVPLQFTEDGGTIAIPAANNLFVLGGDNILTVGSGSTIAIHVDGTTDHAVQIGNATGSLDSIVVGTDGQVLISATAANPAFATITSTDNSITFTPGPNTLDMVVDPLAFGGVLTLSGNDTVKVFPDGTGNIEILTANTTAVFTGTASAETLDFGLANLFIGTTPTLLTSGTNNLSYGNNSAQALSGTDSGNIIIGNIGTAGLNDTTIIGSAQTSFFAAGIDGVSVGNVVTVVTEDTDQLGTADLTAGTNITITPTANVITIASSQAQVLANYRVVNSSPFVVNSTDYYLAVDTSTIPITIQFPDAPTTYRRFIVKDSAGNASVNNITITTVSGVLVIDAATTFVMNSDYQAIELMYSGFGYEIF